MKKFNKITIEEVLERRNEIEVSVMEEQAKVVAIKTERDNIYNIMLEKIKKDLVELNDIYKTLKLEKRMYDSGISFDYTSPVDQTSAIKVEIACDADKKAAILGGINVDKGNRTSIYSSFDVEGFSRKSNISKVYGVWNEVVPTIKQMFADEYIRMQNEKLEKIQRQYESGKATLEELKKMICE
jgi:predicted RNA binding protein with dsRBD fold (UPF0201 family)